MNSLLEKIQRVASEGGEESEARTQVVASSQILHSAIDLLQQTRGKFHVHEYPAGLPFWQKAVINVKRFFGFFTGTRYVEIATAVIDVQNVASQVQKAILEVYTKTLPDNFSQQHKVAVSLEERRITVQDLEGTIELTDQGKFHGVVGGEKVVASDWEELGQRIDQIRQRQEEARAKHTKLVSALEQRVVAEVPPDLPEGAWYLRKEGAAYVLYRQGQGEKRVVVTATTLAENINQLFGVEVSDELFVPHMMWTKEQQNLEQRCIADQTILVEKGQLLKTWLPQEEQDVTFLFKPTDEENKGCVQIGIGERSVDIPIQSDDARREFVVHINEAEYRSSTVDGLKRTLVHNRHLQHIAARAPEAEDKRRQGMEALEAFQRAMGEEIKESTQKEVEGELSASADAQSLAQEGMVVCHPWQKEGKYLLTILKGATCTTFPLDIARRPGTILICHEGRDIELQPHAQMSDMKQHIQQEIGGRGVLFPYEYRKIQELTAPLRSAIVTEKERQTLSFEEFSSLVRTFGKYAAPAYFIKKVRSNSTTIAWWDGTREQTLVVDIMSNPGKLTIAGKPPYESWDALFRGEMRVSTENLISPQKLEAQAQQRQEFVHREIQGHPEYRTQDPTREVYAQIQKIKVPNAWWVSQAREPQKSGFLQGLGQAVIGLVVGKTEALSEIVKQQFVVQVCDSDGQVKDIPLRLAYEGGKWKIRKDDQCFDTIEAFLRAHQLTPQYSCDKVHEQHKRHLAVEQEIESSGVNRFVEGVKNLFGASSSRYFTRESSQSQLLLQRVKNAAKAIGKPVGCIYKANDVYTLVMYTEDGQSQSYTLEIDSTPTPGVFVVDEKQYASFAAFRDTVLRNVVALSDAEAQAKKTERTEATPPKPRAVPVPEAPQRQEPPPKQQLRRVEEPPRPAEPVASAAAAASHEAAPERPTWLDAQESWVTVGKGQRLERDMFKLLTNVRAARSLISCDVAGNLNTNERAFHAWVKMLGKCSDKLSEQHLDDIEGITRELPLLERLWLLEVAVQPKIISSGRQHRAITALERCLKASIKPEEEQLLLSYLAAHSAQYGNAKTREDAVAFLRAKAQP